jgi:NAD(P)-dependent dehydrogenase (short-subunit alcohol dehydrogenase family)
MGLDVNSLLRAGLLEGLGVAVVTAPDAPPGSVGDAVGHAAAGLGALVEIVALPEGEVAEEQEEAAAAALGGALERAGSLRALVVDAASLAGAHRGRDALVGSLASAWNAARSAARLAFLPGDAGGQIVLIAPRAGAEHAAAAAAGLENLARTLSIEWARYGITTVAVAPGADTAMDELAALACYLLSPAGAYFSGCLMDLRGGSSASGGHG